MHIVHELPEKTGMIDRLTQPAFLWLGQQARQIRSRPSLQEEVLDNLVSGLKEDENLLSILLFGSVAAGTQTWKSDIDLIFIYETCDPPSGLINRWVEGIEVQYFFTTWQVLVENVETVPYLLHMFCEARILFDRQGTVAPVVDQLQGYFAAHPDTAAAWARYKELHQVEKKGPRCAQRTIIQIWDELEAKYAGDGPRRTFFTW